MTELPAIEKSVDVPLDPDAAFELFTMDMAAWWPVETHSLSAAEDKLPKRVTVEKKVGGQILEELEDGSTQPWGRITEWEPGARLGIAWHVGRPEEQATQLDIRFVTHGNGTRVHLTHGGWTALGTQAAGTHKGYLTGWDMVLGRCYATHCRSTLVGSA